jgi:hypothetical protein
MSFCLTSTKCSNFGHREFRIRGDSPALTADAVWLIEFLESSVANGTCFRPGETIQIGWMVNLIEEDGADLLTFSEPDFQHFPIKFSRSVTNTLFHLRIQKDTADSLGLLDLLAIPSIRDAASVTEDFPRSAQVHLSRNEPAGLHSGWIVEAVETDQGKEGEPRASKLISLYELAMARSDVIPYLGLPPSIRVLRAGSSKPKVFLNDDEIHIAPKSFLARYLSAKRRVGAQ